MLMGDFLKVLSWVWAFPMLANAEGRTFAVFEVVTNGIWAAVAFLGFRWFPTSEYLGQLFCGIYILYSLATLIYLYRIHTIRLPWRIVRGITVGTLTILWASFLFWNEGRWNGLKAMLCLVPAGIHVAGSLAAPEWRKLVKFLTGQPK
jgi:hypothetical protein